MLQLASSHIWMAETVVRSIEHISCQAEVLELDVNNLVSNYKLLRVERKYLHRERAKSLMSAFDETLR